MQSTLPSANSKKILIVDDHLELIKALSLTLQRKGYQIEYSSNGENAIELAHATIPDLILLDIQMPKIDGYQVCTRLKSHPQTKAIPIIFLTAHDDVDFKVKGLALGGVDYVTKPFDLKEILARIQRQLEIGELHKQLKQKNELLQQEINQCNLIEKNLYVANQQLKKLVVTDSLTKVANRLRFDRYLSQEWKRLTRDKVPLGLIFCDVDYFKLYNDRYGHQAGDYCLTQVAKAISLAVQRPADLVARYGGEEFAVILPNIDSAGTICVAHKIKVSVGSLSIKHELSDVSDYVTLSQGVTNIVPSHQITPDSLIAVADLALYDAKKQGRNRIVFHPYSCEVKTQNFG